MDDDLWSTLQARLEEALPEFLLRQRWYPAKDAGRAQVALARAITVNRGKLRALVAIWRVTPPSGEPLLMFVPLAVVPREHATGIQLVAELTAAEGFPGAQAIVDAFSQDEFVRGWLAIQLDPTERAPVPLETGRTAHARAFASQTGAEHEIHRGNLEQSNTSLRVGELGILKVFRKLEEGAHPELQVGRFLTERGFTATPSLISWVEVAGEGS